MLRLFCTLTALSTGCYFGIKEETRIIHHGDQWQQPIEIGTAIPIVEGHQRGTAVEVRVTWKRMCEYRGVRVGDHVVTRRGALKWMSALGRDGWIILLFEPIILPVSALTTAIRLTGDNTRVTRHTLPLPPRRGPCDSPGAGFAVIVAAPNRDPITVTTASDGRAYVELGDESLARFATVQLAR